MMLVILFGKKTINTYDKLQFIYISKRITYLMYTPAARINVMINILIYTCIQDEYLDFNASSYSKDKNNKEFSNFLVTNSL